ncbi:MAG TPA: hypothetical protein VEJ36_08380 [Nitrososphaerales archaeon]|nr:hypothetical protein [Nitrososphaerales archaeon]
MVSSHSLTRVLYRQKSYKGGTIEVDEVKGVFRVVVMAGLIRKSQMVILAQSYTQPLEISVEGESLSVSGAVLYMSTADEASSLKTALTFIDTAKILGVTIQAARRFLSERASCVDGVIRLKTNPREVLFESFSNASEMTADPVAQMVTSAEEALAKSYETFVRDLSAASNGLPPADLHRVQAATYSIAAVQNSLLSGDISTIKDAIGLLSQAFPADYPTAEEIAGRSEAEITETLMSALPRGPSEGGTV